MLRFGLGRILLLFSFLFCSMGASAISNEFETTFGRVVNELGEPMSGVKIASKKRVGGAWKVISHSKSGENGEFKLKVPRRYGGFDALPTPEGYYPYSYVIMENPLPAYTKEYLVIMKPRGSGKLSGMITDQDNNPVPGVRVNVQFFRSGSMFKSRGARLWRINPRCTWTAISDENGRYEFDNLVAGKSMYAIKSVVPPAKSKLIGLNRKYRFKVSEGNIAVHDFQLFQGASIQGRVLNNKGEPVAGAKVMAFVDRATVNGPKTLYPRLGQSFWSQAFTDENGAFFIGGLSKETYQVRVTPAKESNLAEKSVRMLVLPEKGDIRLPEIVLYPSGSLAFKVLDDEKRRLANASVELYKKELSMGRWGGMRDCLRKVKVSVTNDKGECGFSNLNPGSYQILVIPPANSPSSLKCFKDIHVFNALTTDRLLKLVKGKIFRANVVDEMEEAVPDCRVSLWNRYYTRSAHTDANGDFTIFGMPGEKELLEIDTLRGAKSRLTVFPPKSKKYLRTGNFNFKGEAFPTQLTLQSFENTVSEKNVKKEYKTRISGTAKWPLAKTGFGLLIARNLDVKRKKINRTVFVDSSGTFSIKGLQPGLYNIKLICYNDDYFSNSIFVTLKSGTPLELEIPVVRGGFLRVVPKDENGRLIPLDSLRIRHFSTLKPNCRQSRGNLSSGDKFLYSEPLKPQNYSLSVIFTKAGEKLGLSAPPVKKVEIKSGQLHTVDIIVPKTNKPIVETIKE